MKESYLEKKLPSSLREKTQYATAFGIIAIMLFAAGFPVFLLFFVGVLTFFLWKVFSSEGRNETRRIFEFYLAANEILREDDRRWYGFELQEVIGRGEAIRRGMSSAPPLVYFSLGALYQKIGDHSSAVKNLSQVVGENAPSESAIVYPAKELREYVRMLRKIERTPAEAPVTSSAVRSLERARKNRGEILLEESRRYLAQPEGPSRQPEQKLKSVVDILDSDQVSELSVFNSDFSEAPKIARREGVSRSLKTRAMPNGHAERSGDRKTISEVLHDIYDESKK